MRSLVFFAVLLIYDYFITFSSEVSGIWRRRFTASTILFLANRYGSLLIWVFSWVMSMLRTSDRTVSRFPLNTTTFLIDTHPWKHEEVCLNASAEPQRTEPK